MNDAQQVLFEYLMENQVLQLLPSKYFWHFSRVREQREGALWKSLTEEQRGLLESYQEVAADMHELEQQALFHATWAVAHALL